jgi:hypothetical protein
VTGPNLFTTPCNSIAAKPLPAYVLDAGRTLFADL